MDRKQIEKPLKQYVETIKKAVDPEQIILYGSFARNQASEWSDIDVVVVTNKNEKSLKQLDKAINSIDSRYLFDTRILTPTEFKKASHLSIYDEVKKEGLVIYQKQGSFMGAPPRTEVPARNRT